MLKDILILIIGLIYGASLGIMWCTHQLKKYRNDEESVVRVVVDVEELKKQMKEDEQ